MPWIPLNYIDDIAHDIGELCGMHMYKAEDHPLLRLYAVLCLSKGLSTTNEDVHDAWAAWRAQTQPRHDALVPFAELAQDVQELDSEYRDAIKTVARRRAQDPNAPHP